MVLAKPAKDIPVGDLLSWTRGQLGKRYVFGTAGPNTFDCSGLVLRAFAQYGVKLPHKASDQATYGQAVGRGDIQKGDLVFFNLGRGRNSHVGIATGPNTFIEAANSRNPVRTTTLSAYYRRHLTAVRRMSMVRQAGEEPTAPTAGAGVTPNGVPNGSSATRTRGGGSTTRTTPQGSPTPSTGGDPNGDSGVLDGFTNRIGAGFTAAADAVDDGTAAGSNAISGAADKLGTAVKDAMDPLSAITGVAEKLTALFLPTMMIRIVCGVIGLICILAGCILMVKD